MNVVVRRLPPDVRTWYEAHEPFATLLRLSAGESAQPSVSCEAAREGLDAAHVGFVVLYADASEALRRFVTMLPVQPLADDGQRVLLRVRSCPK